MPRISRMQRPTQMKTTEVVHNKFREEPMLGPCLFPDQGRAPWRWPGLKKSLLILGTGQLAVDLSHVIVSQNRWLVNIVGFLDGKAERVGERLVNPGIIGTYDQLAQLVEQHRVDTIVVCLEDRRSLLPVQSLLDCKAMGLDILDGQHLFEEASGRLSIDSLRPSALIFSTGFRRRLASLVGKRLFDVVVSAVGLVLLIPLFVLIAALIRVDSPGPVFYRQVRVGLRGQPYMIWKFRSMRQDAEKSGPRWAQNNDPRVSRVGWWMRKTRIDELPQLLNVLKGDMSLVGPRPLPLRDYRGFDQDWQRRRFSVRPGITCLWQVNGRSDVSFENWMKLDMSYIDSWSLWLDIQILMRTIPAVIRGSGAA